MGLLDGLLKAAGGGGGDGALEAVTQMLGSHEGGIGGLVKSMESAGLGALATSWISKGANLPISADQITTLLNSSAVAGIAQKLGIDPSQAAGMVAQYLPQVIDHLTPDGQLPSGGGMGAITDLLGMLKR